MKFSLGTLFAIFSALAGYFALVFGMPPWLSVISLAAASALMGPVVVVGVVYDRGYPRTFWIGCATAAFLPYITLMYFWAFYSFAFLFESDLIDSDEGRSVSFSFAACHILILSAGIMAVVARRWLIDRRRPQITCTGPNEGQSPASDVSLQERDS